jgi:hypothetical protein
MQGHWARPPTKLAEKTAATDPPDSQMGSQAAVALAPAVKPRQGEWAAASDRARLQVRKARIAGASVRDFSQVSQ